jgi:hypothetical protein
MIDVRDLSPGIYFLKAETQERTEVSKLIIVKQNLIPIA